MTNGRDYFSASIDTTQFDRDAAHIRNTFNEISRTAESEGSRIEGSFNRVGAIIAGAFGVNQIANFTKSIVNVRSEFQNTEAMFKVFLGSAEKASSFMKDMEKYAYNNVFEFQDLTKQSAQLLAFGTEVENVIPVIDKLSNVAAGVNMPLERLVTLYNKAKSMGKLSSVDIQQWSAMGDVVGYMADMYGKSTDEIRSMISAGEIGFTQLDELLNNLTESGGRFNGMMEEKMKTLGDSVGLLQDSITSMMNKIGEDTEDYLRGGILFANTLVENYETVGKVIIGLIATYGTYKASLVVINALEKANNVVMRQAVLEKNLASMAGIRLSSSEAIQVASKKLLTAQTMRYTAALKAQTLAMATNPAVLLTGAIIGLGLATYKLATYQSDAAKETKLVTDAYNEAEKAANKEIISLSKLKGELDGATKGTKEYNETRDAIVQQFGKYHSGLRTEIEEVGLLDSTYVKLKETITELFLKDKLTSIVADESSKLLETKADVLSKIHDKLVVSLGDEEGSRIYSKLRESIMQDKINFKDGKMYEFIGLDDEIKKAFDKVSGAASGDFIQNRAIEELLGDIIKARISHDRVIEKAKSKFKVDVDKSSEATEKELERIHTLAIEIADTEGDIIRLKKQLDELRSGETKSDDYSSDISKKLKEIKEAEDKLEVLKGKNADDLSSKRLEAQKRLDELDRKRQYDKLSYDIDMQQKELDLMDDSFNKRIAQMKLNHDKEKLKILEFRRELERKQQEYLQEKYIAKNGTSDGFGDFFEGVKANGFISEGKSILPDGLSNEDIEQTINELTEAARRANNAGLQKIGDDLTKMLEDQRLVYSSNLDKQLADIERYYAEQRKLAGDNLELLSVLDDNYFRARQEAYANDKLNELDFSEQIEIEKQAGLQAVGMVEYAESRKLSIQKKYIALRIAALKELADAGNADAIADIERLKTSLDSLEVQKPVSSLRALGDKKLFETISKGYEKTGMSASDAESKTTELFGKIIGGAQMASGVVNDLKTMFGGLDEGLDEALDAVGNIANGFAQGGIIGGIMAVVGEGMKLFSKASEAEARHQEALREIARSKIELQREYNLLLLEQNLLLEEASTIFGTMQVSKASNAFSVYRDALVQFNTELAGTFRPDEMVESFYRKLANLGSKYGKAQLSEYQQMVEYYNKGLAGLGEQQIITGHKKTGFMGWGKGKDVYSSILEVYPDLIDGENRLNKERAQAILDTQKMSDETRAYMENLIALQEQADAALESLRDYLQQTFGDLGGGAVSSIVEAIKSGTDAWKEFGKVGAQVLENLGEQIAYELFFADSFKNLQSQLEEVYGSTKEGETDRARTERIGKEATELVGNFYNGIGSQMEQAQNWMENWKSEAEKNGFDLWGSDSGLNQSSTKRGFETMTQDQAGELNGRFTAIQMITSDIGGKIDIIVSLDSERNTLLATHSAQFQELREVGLKSMYHLEDIVKYTKVLPDMATDIAKVKENTSRL